MVAAVYSAAAGICPAAANVATVNSMLHTSQTS
jgi:hypothetical protein